MIHALGSENQAARGSKTRQRRPTNSGLASMRVQAAMVLGIAVQSSAFLAPPSARAAIRAPRSQASTPVMMAYDVRYSPNRWRDDPEDIKPGFGGIWPGDPDAETHQVTFVNKAGETVAKADVPVDRYIFFATEDAGIDVPIVNKKRMCRNGCCTTCAVKVLEGKVKTEGALGLLKELKKEGYALTCCSLPKSDLVVQLQEEDDVYMKQFGEDFERGGVEWGGFFLDED